MTNQLKVLKQESHLLKLQLNKASADAQEQKLVLVKMEKENKFLRNRVDTLEIEKNELLARRNLNDSFISIPNNDFNEMAELEGKNPMQQIEELEDEIRMLKKHNETLMSSQSQEKQELLTRITELESLVDDLQMEITTLNDELKLKNNQYQNLEQEYNELGTKYETEVMNGSEQLKNLRDSLQKRQSKLEDKVLARQS